MSVQKLLAILVALSVLFAPSAAYAAMPMAVASHDDMQMMEMGHCQMLPSKSSEHKKFDGNSCCISMCMTVAVAPSTPAEAVEPKLAATYFAVPQSWHGYLAEIATPPPRIA